MFNPCEYKRLSCDSQRILSLWFVITYQFVRHEFHEFRSRPACSIIDALVRFKLQQNNCFKFASQFKSN